MDKIEKWSKIVETVFSGEYPIVSASSDKVFNINFDDSNTSETKLIAHADIYACLDSTTWITPFSFQCPFPFDMTQANKIKNIDGRKKIELKNSQEEKAMYEQISNNCDVDVILLLGGFEEDLLKGKRFVIGLTNIQNVSIKNTQEDLKKYKKIESEIISSDECATCRKKEKLFRCSRCKKSLYCSVECQKKSWIDGHSKICI